MLTASLSAAREMLLGFCRRRRRLAAAGRVVTALLWGGGAAAAVGLVCAVKGVAWPWAGVAGGLAFCGAVFCRPPWRGLPSAADTALYLDRRENWQDAASTLLALPEKSPANAAFARWLAPRLPAWQRVRLPYLPENFRFLLLPVCFLLAEGFLGMALTSAPEPPSPLSIGMRPARTMFVPIDGGLAPDKKEIPHYPGANPRTMTDAPQPREPDTKRPEDFSRSAAASGHAAGAGKNADGTGVSPALTARPDFVHALPELAPAAIRGPQTDVMAIPLPYRQAVTRYLEATR